MEYEFAKYQANCSETTFRLIGTLKELKKSVLQMIEINIEDRIEGEENKEEAREIERKRWAGEIEAVKSIKDITEFEKIVIGTCNYDTFFKASCGDLRVASSNNISWDGLDNGKGNYQQESSDEYSQIAGYEDCKIHSKHQELVVLEYKNYDKNDEEITHKIIVNQADLDKVNYKDYNNKIKYKVNYKDYNNKIKYEIRQGSSKNYLRINNYQMIEIEEPKTPKAEALRSLIELGGLKSEVKKDE